MFKACSGGINPSRISSHFCLFQHHLSLTPSLPSFFIFKDSVGKIEATQIIQAKLSISKSLTFIASEKSLLPYQVMYSQASWIRCGCPWGPLLGCPCSRPTSPVPDTHSFSFYTFSTSKPNTLVPLKNHLQSNAPKFLFSAVNLLLNSRFTYPTHISTWICDCHLKPSISKLKLWVFLYKLCSPPPPPPPASAKSVMVSPSSLLRAQPWLRYLRNAQACCISALNSPLSSSQLARLIDLRFTHIPHPHYPQASTDFHLDHCSHLPVGVQLSVLPLTQAPHCKRTEF